MISRICTVLLLRAILGISSTHAWALPVMTGSVLTYEGDPAHPNITVTCDVHSVAGPGVTRVVQIYKEYNYLPALNGEFGRVHGMTADGEPIDLISTDSQLNESLPEDRYSVSHNSRAFSVTIRDPIEYDSGMIGCRVIITSSGEEPSIRKSDTTANITVVAPVNDTYIFYSDDEPNQINMIRVEGNDFVTLHPDAMRFFGCAAEFGQGLPTLRGHWEDANGHAIDLTSGSWVFENGKIDSVYRPFPESTYFVGNRRRVMLYRAIPRSGCVKGSKFVCEAFYPDAAIRINPVEVSVSVNSTIPVSTCPASTGCSRFIGPSALLWASLMAIMALTKFALA